MVVNEGHALLSPLSNPSTMTTAAAAVVNALLFRFEPPQIHLDVQASFFVELVRLGQVVTKLCEYLKNSKREVSVPSKLLVIGPRGSEKTRNNVFSLTDNKWHL